MASALVFLMIPGIALVYAGVADRYSAITMARIPLITTAFVGLQVSPFPLCPPIRFLLLMNRTPGSGICGATRWRSHPPPVRTAKKASLGMEVIQTQTHLRASRQDRLVQKWAQRFPNWCTHCIKECLPVLRELHYFTRLTFTHLL